MGLDWCVMPKVENGVEVQATSVIGARRLSPDDPETIAAYRAIWQSWQDRMPKRHPIVAAVIGYRKLKRMLGLSSRPVTHGLPEFEEWRGPFEEVLQRGYARKPPIIVIPCSPEGAAGIPRNIAAVQYFGFRGQQLESRFNEITAWLEEDPSSPDEEEEILQRAFENRSPGQMLTLAAALERVLAAYQAAHPEPDAESVEVYEDAIRWLRFWGSRGFGFVADY